MIKVVIFDIGNVLLAFDYSRALAEFQRHAGRRLDEDAVMRRVLELRDDFECGRLPLADFTARLREITGHPGGDRDIQLAYADIFEPLPASWRLVEQLAADYPLDLLSNTSELHLEFVRAKFPVFQHFRQGTYSHEVGCMKPDPRIYQTAIEQSGSQPHELVFIDDMPRNVEAARAAGLHAHHYRHDRHHELLEFLQRLGVVGGR